MMNAAFRMNKESTSRRTMDPDIMGTAADETTKAMSPRLKPDRQVDQRNGRQRAFTAKVTGGTPRSQARWPSRQG